MTNLQRTIKPPSEHYLHGISDVIQIIIPEETTNLISNPSVELNTTGYNGLRCNLSRNSSYQARGIYSLKCSFSLEAEGATWTDLPCFFGTYYDISLTAQLPYVFSFDMYANEGKFISAYLATSSGIALSTTNWFIGKNKWIRAWLKFSAMTTGNYRLYITQYLPVGDVVRPFYIDGLQLENKTYRTTYCDGDITDYYSSSNDYRWLGVKHNSHSYRNANTYTGGKIINISELGLNIINIHGFGLGVMNADLKKSAMGGYSYFNGYISDTRRFSLSADITYDYLRKKNINKNTIIDVITGSKTVDKVPITFRFSNKYAGQNYEEEIYNIGAVYAGGLEGAITNEYYERIIIAFDALKPYVYSENDNVVRINTSTTITSPYVIKKAFNSNWAGYATFNGKVNVIKESPDGKIYFGGNFTTISGVSAKAIAYYDGTAFHQVSTGLSGGEVYDIEFDNSGNAYIVGSFTRTGNTLVNYRRIVYYSSSTNTFSAIDKGFNSTAYKIKYGTDGLLYIVGKFTYNEDNTVTLNRVARINGASLENVGNTQVVNDVYDFTFSGNTLYISGVYPVVTNSGSSGVGKTTIPPSGPLGALTYTPCGNSVSSTQINTTQCITTTDDGIIYALENGSGGTGYLKKYYVTGVWEIVGNGLSNIDSSAVSFTNLYYTLDESSKKILVACGHFSKSGDYEFYGGISKLIGNTWTPLSPDIKDSTLDTSLDGICYYASKDSSVYVTYNGTGNIIIPGISSSFYIYSDVITKPKLIINGVGILKSITNETTGRSIYFSGLSVILNEVITLDLDGEILKLTSTVKGNISNKIIPGSDIISFGLVNGYNVITVMYYNSSGSAGTVDLQYKTCKSTMDLPIGQDIYCDVAITKPTIPIAIRYLLLETSDNILLETGDNYMLENYL